MGESCFGSMWSALIYVCFHLQVFGFCLHHLLSTHTHTITVSLSPLLIPLVLKIPSLFLLTCSCRPCRLRQFFWFFRNWVLYTNWDTSAHVLLACLPACFNCLSAHLSAGLPLVFSVSNISSE